MSDELLDKARECVNETRYLSDDRGYMGGVIAALVARCGWAEADADRLAVELSAICADPENGDYPIPSSILIALRFHDEAVAQR